MAKQKVGSADHLWNIREPFQLQILKKYVLLWKQRLTA
jgi:hypothetical protein